MGVSRTGGSSRRVTRVSALLGVTLLMAACGADEGVPESALGMRTGSGLFDGERFLATEAWLGNEIDWTVQFTGRKTQRDMNGSAFGLLASPDATLPDFADRLSLSLSIPLAFGRANARTREGRQEIKANLDAVTAGEFDEAYTRVATRLVDAGYGDAVLRLGHEFNGAWAPWSSRTNEDEYIAAWRHVHDLFAAVSDEFRFDWTATRPAWFEWGPAAYPGDDYVDIVGLDLYWRVQEGDDAWDGEIWSREYLRVMRSHQSFAAERDKLVSYPEWGLSGADSPEFIAAMYDWLSELPTNGPGALEYQSFFDSGPEYRLDQFPLASEAFRDSFG